MTNIITEGEVAKQVGLNPADPMVGPMLRKLTDEARRDFDLRMECVSPRETLNLPELLDKRRIEYAVPDGAFRIAALFDRVLLWPIPDADVEEGKGSKLIHLPETTRKNEDYRRPRCLLIGAGIQALDILRSNGVDLGHIVFLLHLNPWWVPIQKSQWGMEWSVRVCQVGDLCGDEDLGLQLRSGEISYEEDPDDHLLRIKQREGKPIRPSMREDY